MKKDDMFIPYIYALENINPEDIQKAAEIIHMTVASGGRVFLAGNGGASTIAQHMASDLMKPVGDGISNFFAGIINLSDNTALMTAIANDIDYKDVFAWQLCNHDAGGDDVVIGFSVSGTSPNIVKLFSEARYDGCAMIMVTGLPYKDRYYPEWKDIQREQRFISVSTGLDKKSPNLYYICESVFSCIAHAIANEFHTLRGNYSA